MSEIEIVVMSIVAIVLTLTTGGNLVLNLLNYLNRPDVTATIEERYNTAAEQQKQLVDLLRDSMAFGERLAISVVPVGSDLHKAITGTGDFLDEISDGVPADMKPDTDTAGQGHGADENPT